MISELKSWNEEDGFESTFFAPHATEMRKYLEKRPMSPLLGYKYHCILGKDEHNVDILVGASYHGEVILDDGHFGHASVRNLKELTSILMTYFQGNDAVEILSASMCPVNEYGYIPDQVNGFTFYLLQGASFRGDNETGVQPGLIYCTTNFKGKGYKRYDYVVVDLEDDDGNRVTQVAQVISIVAMMKNSTNIKDAEYLFIVQYMQEDDHPSGTRTEFNSSFKQLKWEQYKIGNQKLQYSIHCISFENIIDTAVIIPFFSYETKSKGIQQMPIMGKPHINDRFYYIEKLYFDRSVWDELTNDGDNYHNVEGYISENFIGIIPTENLMNDDEEEENNSEGYEDDEGVETATAAEDEEQEEEDEEEME